MNADRGLGQIRIVAAEELDHIRILVRRTAFDGGRQVQDEALRRRRPPFPLDRAAEVEHEIEIAVGELLGRKFIPADLFESFALNRFADHAGALDRHRLDLVPRMVEDEAAVQVAGRDVAVDQRLLHAAQRFGGPVDQVLPRLGQNRDRHVVRNQVLFDQHPHEVVVIGRGGRERDFDLLETDFDQHVEVFKLVGRAHRLRERLVAVAQIHGGPFRGLGDDPVRPLPVFDFYRVRIAIFRIAFHDVTVC